MVQRSGITDEPDFSDLWARGRRLHKYRSKMVAHRDIAAPSYDFAKDTGFTYDNLKAIVDDACVLFDRAAEKSEFQRLLPLSCEEDFLSLVRDLRAPQRI